MDVSDWRIEGTMANAQRAAVIAALVHCNYSISAAAVRLGISRSTLYRLIRALAIDLPPSRSSVDIVLHSQAEMARASPHHAVPRRFGQRSGAGAHDDAPSRVIFHEGEWLLVKRSAGSETR